MKKLFKPIRDGVNLQNFFCVFEISKNKLECLSVANISSLVNYLRARQEPTLVEHCMARCSFVLLGWKYWLETKALSYSAQAQKIYNISSLV